MKMKWHKCTDELPKDTHSGSYLIINHFGDIAEAEYRGNNDWYLYRWATYLHGDHVLAWCSFDDIEKPLYLEKNNE